MLEAHAFGLHRKEASDALFHDCISLPDCLHLQAQKGDPAIIMYVLDKSNVCVRTSNDRTLIL
jgi:hypothetical protein